MMNTTTNIKNSHMLPKFLVLTTFYSLNEHSSNRDPNEKTYKIAYHNTDES